jgi:HSP20 family protein
MAWVGFSSPSGAAPGDLFDRLRRELDTVFDQFAVQQPRASSGVEPPLALYESDDAYILTAELPGLKQEDLELSVEGPRLTLRGERRIELPADPKLSVHRRERRGGVFRRTVELPAPVESEKVEALYRDGVLTVRLPKQAQHRPRRIEVRTH